MTVKVLTNHRSRCHNHVNGRLPIEILIVIFARVATTPNKPKGVNDCSQKGSFYLRAPSPVTNREYRCKIR